METGPSVYDYEEPSSYLRDVLAHKKSRNRFFSLRAWSQQMGFRCHTSLVFFLRGKRRVRPEHVEKLNRSLRLSEEEERFFRVLVQKAHVKTPVERAELEARANLLRPTRGQALLDAEKFRYVADWLHMAILEITELADFEPSSAWIARRLGRSQSAKEVANAVDRLLQLGLLQRKNGTLVKTNARLTTAGDRGSAAVREHHRQILALAAESIEGQSVQERVLNASSLTIDSSRLPEAKELILKFRADMAKLLEKKGGDQTYELSIQLFKLTNHASEKLQ